MITFNLCYFKHSPSRWNPITNEFERCDLRIVLDDQSECFAQMNVLAEKSPFIKTLYEKYIQRINLQNDKIVLLRLKIKDIESVKTVVQYFYSEKVSIRITEIYNVIRAAILLQAGNLDSRIVQEVNRCITDANIANSDYMITIRDH